MSPTAAAATARRPFLGKLAALLAAPLLLARPSRAAASPEPGPEPGGSAMTALIGQIALLPYEFVPRGWALCNGQELPIQGHASLFSLIGTNFGGDGRRTFRVPSMKPPYSGVRYMICTDGGTFPVRT